MRRFFRAEPNCLIIYNLTERMTAKISGKNLQLLNQWLGTGEINDFLKTVSERGFIDLGINDQEKEELKQIV